MSNDLINFDEVLSQSIESVERPKPIPVGLYEATVGKHELVASKTKGEPMVNFDFHITNPGPDVDPILLTEAGGIESAQRFPLQRNFMMTSNLIWRLRAFIEKACKVPIAGLSFVEALPQTQGKSVMVKITHRESEGNFYSQVESVSAKQDA